MKYKIIKSSKAIQNFGGLNCIINTFEKKGLKKYIDNKLAERAPQAEYSYSDVFFTVIYSMFCGAECLDDINELKKHFKGHPELKLCSPDTVEYASQQIKADTIEIRNGEVVHEFNINENLNNLLIGISKYVGLLDCNTGYTLDYDNVILANEKYDSRPTYKYIRGYQPGVAFIGCLPVYIEGRNGNTPAKYLQSEALARCFAHLKSSGIKIEHFRGDCASYQKDVIDVVEQNSRYFYIRLQDSQQLMEQIRGVTLWEEAEINYQNYGLASIEYRPFGAEKIYRAVVLREERKDGQMDLFTGGNYTYRSILTNNKKESNKEVVEFFNQRGGQEKNFAVLNNDFNWKKLPFSFLDVNTVFMFIGAIANNLFEYIKETYSKVVDFVDRKMRIKRFIFSFMAVPYQWTKSGRQLILKLYTEKKYELLL